MAAAQDSSFDCIVLGAGIIGLNAAWDLAQNQHAKTLVIEQFPFPHSRGSSAGQSRIYRNAYTQPPYTQLMKVSMPIWRQIESLTRTKILIECGLLYGGDSETKHSVINSLQNCGLKYECLKFPEVSDICFKPTYNSDCVSRKKLHFYSNKMIYGRPRFIIV